MPRSPRLMPGEIRDVVINLHISDQQTRGHPVLRPGETALARAWLAEAITDTDKLEKHVELLAELHGMALEPPVPRANRPERETPAALRWAGFRHCELLAEERADAVAERGPEALTEDELARLLLNPFALYDLADLVRTRLPDWWIEPLAEAGRDVLRRYELVVELPAVGATGGEARQLVRFRGRGPLHWSGASLVIGFAADALVLKRRIAEHLYGLPEQDFTLTLHRRSAAEDRTFVVELEVAPAPLKEDLTLTVAFKGLVRVFRVAVPPSVRLDPEADAPERAFATADQPVPEEAFDLKRDAEWRDDTWPPYLVLRCRRSPALVGR